MRESISEFPARPGTNQSIYLPKSTGSTLEALAMSRHDWEIVDWDLKPQPKQTNLHNQRLCFNRVTDEAFIAETMVWILRMFSLLLKDLNFLLLFGI